MKSNYFIKHQHLTSTPSPNHSFIIKNNNNLSLYNKRIIYNLRNQFNEITKKRLDSSISSLKDINLTVCDNNNNNNYNLENTLNVNGINNLNKKNVSKKKIKSIKKNNNNNKNNQISYDLFNKLKNNFLYNSKQSNNIIENNKIMNKNKYINNNLNIKNNNKKISYNNINNNKKKLHHRKKKHI